MNTDKKATYLGIVKFVAKIIMALLAIFGLSISSEVRNEIMKPEGLLMAVFYIAWTISDLFFSKNTNKADKPK